MDWALSFGVFDGEDLVAFILNGVGLDDGLKTAFNTGTGVLPAYRGHGWVDRLYAFAREPFAAAGIEQCKLEVITENHRAIRVYERIGFRILRRVRCFSGALAVPDGAAVALVPISLMELRARPKAALYSWDHTDEAISQIWDSYQGYEVLGSVGGNVLGWFVINPANGYIPQLESPQNDWDAMFSGIAQIATTIKINNIDDQWVELLDTLLALGVHNSVDQFEMGMIL